MSPPTATALQSRQPRPQVKALVWPIVEADDETHKERTTEAFSTSDARSLPVAASETDLVPEVSQQRSTNPEKQRRPRPQRAKTETFPASGSLLVPYEDSEVCSLFLEDEENRTDCFVTVRLGPLDTDGLVIRSESIKITGDWQANSDLQWVLKGVPLAKMASKSPAGIVGVRFKIWAQGWISRRWTGRTYPVAVPSPLQELAAGHLQLLCEVRRGCGAEAAATSEFAKVVDVHQVTLQPNPAGVGGISVVCLPLAMEMTANASSQVAPRQQEHSSCFLQRLPEHASSSTASSTHTKALGKAILKAATARQWGYTTALLRGLGHASDESKRRALAEVDATRKTALRMCVDGLTAERPPVLQALEGSVLTMMLDVRRPYWWKLHIKDVCQRTLWFVADVTIGMPRPKTMEFPPAARPWTPSVVLPSVEWEECRWSSAQEFRGYFKEDISKPPAIGTKQLAKLVLNDELGTELSIVLVDPSKVIAFGDGQFRNPLGISLVGAIGRIAGIPATGVFDPCTCSRLTSEFEVSSPREASSLAYDAGADCRALADDGLSPFTSTILGQDPCGLLIGLSPSLRLRMLRNDKDAWAEVARSSIGEGHCDISAGALSRGLLIPDNMAEDLLDHCFKANLPLLASRVLARVDGQQFLMKALERAEDPSWLRASERILLQRRKGCKPSWLEADTVRYSIQELRKGRQQFRLLLTALLNHFAKQDDQDFFAHPPILPAGQGGAECPICFEPLSRGTPVALVDANEKAICSHFLCSSCAKGFAASSSSQGDLLRCPECRRHAGALASLPVFTEDPLRWFDFLSGSNSNDCITRAMLFRAISAMLPVDSDALEAAVSAEKSFLCNSPFSQEVSAAEFMTNGLYAWVLRHLLEHQRCMNLQKPADLSDRAAWFKYWNLSRSDRLTKHEVLRAILRTFGVSSLDRNRLEQMKARVDSIWAARITSQNQRLGHCDPNTITCEEFSSIGGLGDLLDEAFSLEPGGDGLHPPSPKEAANCINPLKNWKPGNLHHLGHRQRRGQRESRMRYRLDGTRTPFELAGHVIDEPFVPSERVPTLGLPPCFPFLTGRANESWEESPPSYLTVMRADGHVSGQLDYHRRIPVEELRPTSELSSDTSFSDAEDLQPGEVSPSSLLERIFASGTSGEDDESEFASTRTLESLEVPNERDPTFNGPLHTFEEGEDPLRVIEDLERAVLGWRNNAVISL